MGLFGTVVGLMKSELMPNKKVLAAYASAGVVSGLTVLVNRKGRRIPKKHVAKVVNAVVAVASLVPPSVAYMKRETPKEVTR
jgi:hypothetical protein